jgi:hypothetical protein
VERARENEAPATRKSSIESLNHYHGKQARKKGMEMKSYITERQEEAKATRRRK